MLMCKHNTEMPPMELPPVSGNPDEEPAEFEVHGNDTPMEMNFASSSAATSASSSATVEQGMVM